MALTKTYVTVLASTSNAAGGTKASPSTTSGVLDCNSFYNGVITWAITNGTAPTAPVWLTFQVSGDGTSNWRDLYSVMGDTTLNSAFTGAFEFPRGIKFLRVIAYNNTGAAVTVAAELEAETSL